MDVEAARVMQSAMRSSRQRVAYASRVNAAQVLQHAVRLWWARQEHESKMQRDAEGEGDAQQPRRRDRLLRWLRLRPPAARAPPADPAHASAADPARASPADPARVRPRKRDRLLGLFKSPSEQASHDYRVAEGCKERREPSFLQYRWFYRQQRDGLWVPFSLSESAQIEEQNLSASDYALSCEESEALSLRTRVAGTEERRVWLRGEPVLRFVQIDERRMYYAASGEHTEVLRGTWFYTRSDRLLQPYSEDVAERLSAAVHNARETDLRAFAFDAGQGRTITASAGGGYVQRSAGGTLRLVTRLYVTSGMPHSQERTYARLKSAPLQCAQDAHSVIGEGGRAAAQGASPAPALPSVVSWCPPQVGREVLEVPPGTGEQWFYFRDDGTWMPYAAAQNSLLCHDARAAGWVELVGEGKQGAGATPPPPPAGTTWGHMMSPRHAQALPSVVTWWPTARQSCPSPSLATQLRHPAVKYVVCRDEGWQVNVSTGTFRRVVSSRWFFQRSDGRLQPLPRAVDAAVQSMCQAGWDPKRTSLAVGSDRVITAGVLGGLVQVRIQSKRCRFVTNRFCQSMPFVVHDYSLHPNYMDVAPYEEAKQLLAFRERWSARVKVHFLKFALQSALLELMY